MSLILVKKVVQLALDQALAIASHVVQLLQSSTSISVRKLVQKEHMNQ